MLLQPDACLRTRWATVGLRSSAAALLSACQIPIISTVPRFMACQHCLEPCSTLWSAQCSGFMQPFKRQARRVRTSLKVEGAARYPLLDDIGCVCAWALDFRSFEWMRSARYPESVLAPLKVGYPRAHARGAELNRTQLAAALQWDSNEGALLLLLFVLSEILEDRPRQPVIIHNSC